MTTTPSTRTGTFGDAQHAARPAPTLRNIILHKVNYFEPASKHATGIRVNLARGLHPATESWVLTEVGQDVLALPPRIRTGVIRTFGLLGKHRRVVFDRGQDQGRTGIGPSLGRALARAIPQGTGKGYRNLAASLALLPDLELEQAVQTIDRLLTSASAASAASGAPLRLDWRDVALLLAFWDSPAGSPERRRAHRQRPQRDYYGAPHPHQGPADPDDEDEDEDDDEAVSGHDAEPGA